MEARNNPENWNEHSKEFQALSTDPGAGPKILAHLDARSRPGVIRRRPSSDECHWGWWRMWTNDSELRKH